MIEPSFAMLSYKDLHLVVSSPNPLTGEGRDIPDDTQARAWQVEPLCY